MRVEHRREVRDELLGPLNSLYSEGAHLVLLRNYKEPFVRGWQQPENRPDCGSDVSDICCQRTLPTVWVLSRHRSDSSSLMLTIPHQEEHTSNP